MTRIPFWVVLTSNMSIVVGSNHYILFVSCCKFSIRTLLGLKMAWSRVKKLLSCNLGQN